MKIKTTTLLCILALNSIAQTSIPGGNVSGTWTLANSPYLIQGSIQIQNGSTLTIQPGVTVNFQGNYKLVVLGRLLAIGTSADTIIFTATNTSTGWRSIRFPNTSATNDTSKIVFCKLEYGKATATSPDDNGGGIYFSNFSKAIVSNSRIINCVADNSGGGIYCISASPVIKNNTISDNIALGSNQSGGGGIYCSNNNSSITNNTINFNDAAYGAGIYCTTNTNSIISGNTINNNTGNAIYVDDNSSPNIVNNSIAYNTSAYLSGGIYIYYGSPTINTNDISHNSGFNGGGIYSSGNLALTTITNNIISYNTATTAGGGIYCFDDSAAIVNNTFSNNSALAANYGGGGIFFQRSNDLLSNNTVTNNSAVGNGGGIYFWDISNPKLINNTISYNTAANGGGIYLIDNSNPAITNNILWGNTANSTGNQVYLNDEASDPSFYNCDVQGSSAAFELNGNFYTGTYQNNISSDPLFVSPSGSSGTGYNGVTADWSLQAGSPCINTGNPTGVYPATDKAGNPRVVNSVIDIGAYENQIITSVIENTHQQLISVYPNPSMNGDFVITLNDISLNPIAVAILTLQGKQVMYETVNAKSVEGAKLELHLNELAPGTYLTRVEMSNGTMSAVRLSIVE